MKFFSQVFTESTSIAARPVQCVDRQSLVVVHGGQRGGQAGAVHVRFGAEGQAVEIHFELSVERAAEGAHVQIRNDQQPFAIS